MSMCTVGVSALSELCALWERVHCGSECTEDLYIVIYRSDDRSYSCQ